jgi:hypothetical protein
MQGMQRVICQALIFFKKTPGCVPAYLSFLAAGFQAPAPLLRGQRLAGGLQNRSFSLLLVAFLSARTGTIDRHQSLTYSAIK